MRLQGKKFTKWVENYRGRIIIETIKFMPNGHCMMVLKKHPDQIKNKVTHWLNDKEIELLHNKKLDYNTYGRN